MKSYEIAMIEEMFSVWFFRIKLTFHFFMRLIAFLIVSFGVFMLQLVLAGNKMQNIPSFSKATTVISRSHYKKSPLHVHQRPTYMAVARSEASKNSDSDFGD